MSTVADVLDRAADVIAERGHCKGDYEGPDGSVCAIGALLVAIAGGPADPLNARQFHTYMSARDWASDVVGNAVARWNDAPERTADEVIAALREAARRERGAA
jgi:putative intracellular protease/amidase